MFPMEYSKTSLACEQTLLFGQVKRVSRERASERRRREGQRRWLQALLSSAPRSRVIGRLASLAQIGELARRLRHLHPADFHEERITGLKQYENELNFKDIDFPVKLKDIEKFQKKIWKRRIFLWGGKGYVRVVEVEDWRI